MAKNTSPPRVAQLQRVVAEPITDPAEQAALDEQRRRARGNDEPLSEENGASATQPGAAPRLLELSRQLSKEEQGALFARLGAELPTERRFELLARVLGQLPPENLRLLEGELTARLGQQYGKS